MLALDALYGINHRQLIGRDLIRSKITDVKLNKLRKKRDGRETKSPV